MAEAQLSPPSYLKHAFNDQHNVVLLFGAACFSLAFASPVPLFVSAAGELIWLLVGPRLPAFRAWVDRKLSVQYLARAEAAIEGALCELDEHDVNRYLAVSRNATRLVTSAQGRLPARELELGVHGLLELRRTFLDYLFLSQRVEALVDATPQATIEKEIAELQESYRTERELTARMTIRQTRTSLERLLSQQSALGSVRRSLELRLTMLERSLPSLESRLADPTFELASGIEGALTEIGSTEALELAVDQIFADTTAFVAR